MLLRHTIFTLSCNQQPVLSHTRVLPIVLLLSCESASALTHLEEVVS